MIPFSHCACQALPETPLVDYVKKALEVDSYDQAAGIEDAQLALPPEFYVQFTCISCRLDTFAVLVMQCPCAWPNERTPADIRHGTCVGGWPGGPASRFFDNYPARRVETERRRSRRASVFEGKKNRPISFRQRWHQRCPCSPGA